MIPPHHERLAGSRFTQGWFTGYTTELVHSLHDIAGLHNLAGSRVTQYGWFTSYTTCLVTQLGWFTVYTTWRVHGLHKTIGSLFTQYSWLTIYTI